MDKKIILVVAALAALAVGVTLMEKKGSHVKSELTGKKVLASEDFQKIDNIVLKRGEEKLTLKNNDGNWIMIEQESFPADASKIVKLLEDTANITYLRLVSNAKTKWADLEVEGKNSLRLTGKGYQKEFAVGKNRPGGGLYLRNMAKDTTYLVDKSINISTEPSSWEYRTLVRLGDNKVKKVKFPGQKGQAVTLEREANDKPFKVAKIEKGETFNEKDAGIVKNLLSKLDYSKKTKRTDEYNKALDKAPKVEITSFDGNVVNLQIVVVTKEIPATDDKKKSEVEKKYFVHIESDAKAHAATAELMKDWQFEVSEYQANDFRKTRSDFVKKSDS